jgi:phosphoribosylformylglycinamidine cyclo-ligase
MTPTRIYVKPLLAAMKEVRIKGMSHITGGGLVENIPRCLPEGTKAVLDKRCWPQPEVFNWLQREGGVAPTEMQRTFNCGIGFVVIVAEADAERAAGVLREQGQSVHSIGRIEARTAGEVQAQVVG